MKLLIVGGGGREHALAWKFLQDDPTLDLVAAPGNPGIATLARCVPIKADDVAGLIALARTERPELTVVGPEAALAEGIVDRFRAEGFVIFGPTRAAARIETSKRFAKDLMQSAGVPTARASHHSDSASAIRAARVITDRGGPVVVKASGLAAGKGVVIASTFAEAEHAILAILDEHAFGVAGHELLVEEFMEGEELSVFAVCDGSSALLMAGVQDHKRLEDGDRGPNTGGMGAYAPVSLDTDELQAVIMKSVFTPTLAALSDSGAPFTGLLYAGLMLAADGPRVVEFNCRFGDPETEAMLPLMASPLLDAVTTVARGESLAGAEPFQWRKGGSVTTVLAAAGYPGQVRAGDPISFPPPVDDVYVFHAGTRVASTPCVHRDGRSAPDPAVVTAGGRVLTVTAVADTLPQAAATSVAYAEAIHFEGKQLRRDIAWRELARMAGKQATGA